MEDFCWFFILPEREKISWSDVGITPWIESHSVSPCPLRVMIEDVNRDMGNEIISNVGKVIDIKELSPENLKPVVEILSHLACEKEFMRKGARQS